jgi:hypothetical protein
MLEGIPVKIDIIIEIIRIGEELISLGKHIRSTHIHPWKKRLRRISDLQHILLLVIQVLALFVAQVGIRVSVAYNL